jgi:hypothetical protein
MILTPLFDYAEFTLLVCDSNTIYTRYEPSYPSLLLPIAAGHIKLNH